MPLLVHGNNVRSKRMKHFVAKSRCKILFCITSCAESVNIQLDEIIRVFVVALGSCQFNATHIELCSKASQTVYDAVIEFLYFWVRIVVVEDSVNRFVRNRLIPL